MKEFFLKVSLLVCLPNLTLQSTYAQLQFSLAGVFTDIHNPAFDASTANGVGLGIGLYKKIAKRLEWASDLSLSYSGTNNVKAYEYDISNSKLVRLENIAYQLNFDNGVSYYIIKKILSVGGGVSAGLSGIGFDQHYNLYFSKTDLTSTTSPDPLTMVKVDATTNLLQYGLYGNVNLAFSKHLLVYAKYNYFLSDIFDDKTVINQLGPTHFSMLRLGILVRLIRFHRTSRF